MVTRWLERDAGKHHLRPDDKIDLAEHLAAHLHGAGAGLLDVTALEDWMHEWLETSPRLARRYARLHPDQLEEDLRTATFLARIDGSEGSGFRFAHTSLREYFHACHLFAAIKADDPGAWDIEVPSPETLGFLGQLLAERGGSELLARLTSWGRERGGRVSRVILQYAVAAANGGWSPLGWRLTSASCTPRPKPSSPSIPSSSRRLATRRGEAWASGVVQSDPAPVIIADDL